MNSLLSKIAPILEWLKTNPLLLFCGVIILLSVGSFFWPTQYYSSAFHTQLEARDGEARQIQNFFNTPVDLPPVEPDDPPRTIKTIAKAKVTEKLTQIYTQMGAQHDDIFKIAVAENQKNHTLLVDGLFPEPGEEGDMLPYTGRKAYTDSFARIYQQLDAGSAPDADEVKASMEHDEESYRAKALVGNTAPLTEPQKAELTKLQATNLLRLSMANAANHHLYADPVILVTGGAHPMWKPGPFQVQDWARRGTKPTQTELWAGQMDVWIQQDLCSAIAIANHVGDPSIKSLVECPVKRLLSLQVQPDYIGLVRLPPPPPAAPGTPPALPAFPDDKTIRDQLNKRLVDNFTASATGRVTNYLYDVRGCSMSVIVESRRIPEFLNALGQVNFTTIVGMAMKDIDEFEALRSGYWYGDCDVVQLDLKLESIWLRNWTAGHFSKEDAVHLNEKENMGYMPDAVRVYLGLKPWNPEKYLKDITPKTPGAVIK